MLRGGKLTRAAVAALAFWGPPATGAEAAQASAVVRGVRSIPSDELTRIVIECTSRTAYRLRRSRGVPTRITVDLRRARLPSQGLAPQRFETGPLQGWKAIRTSDGVRLVLDARARAEAAAFSLQDPFRLVVDVAGSQNGTGPAAVRTAPTQPPSRSARRQKPVRPWKVVIDAGHGGRDPGAVGVRGLREKDVALAIARRLAAKLRSTGAFDVVLTRERDAYLALEERTAVANRHTADLFVSIHANASRNRRSSGVETYYLNNTDDRATIRLAKLENGLTLDAGKRRGDDLSWILTDLLQSYKIEESVGLAEQVQASMVRSLRRDHPTVRDLGVKSGPFFVLVGATMPCVLVEVSFLSHPQEGVRLATSSYQDAIAEGLLQGLRRFVENRHEAGTL